MFEEEAQGQSWLLRERNSTGRAFSLLLSTDLSTRLPENGQTPPVIYGRATSILAGDVDMISLKSSQRAFWVIGIQLTQRQRLGMSAENYTWLLSKKQVHFKRQTVCIVRSRNHS